VQLSEKPNWSVDAQIPHRLFRPETAHGPATGYQPYMFLLGVAMRGTGKNDGQFTAYTFEYSKSECAATYHTDVGPDRPIKLTDMSFRVSDFQLYGAFYERRE